MNDCVWAYIVGCSDEIGCKCCGYRSMNSDNGEEIMEAYEKDIEEAIKPVKVKWQEYFESNEW